MMVINTFMSTADFRAAGSVHTDGRRPLPPVDMQSHALRYDTVLQMKTRQYNRTDNACNFDLTVLKQNFAQLVKTELYALGLMDAGELAPYLYRYFNHRINSVIIDVGANLGDTTARLMSLFTVSDCERFHANVHLNGSFDNCEYWKSQVVAVEPVPATFQKLVERAKTEFWYKTGFQAHQLALTDNVAPGEMVKFYTKGVQGDQQGGLNTFSTGGQEFLEVPADTLDHFVSTLKYNHDAPIFLLKVDCEGFDASS
jgi:FkbM family methyltransferase